MSVTAQLLELYHVDKQLRGLRSRLDQSERFLAQQQAASGELRARTSTIEAQLKALRAAVKNDEGEAARLDAKIEALRTQMNSAKTAKEYNAFLAELGNYKDEKGTFETRALENMARIDELERELAGINSQNSEREKMVQKAQTDRDARAAEIKDRLEELTQKRAALATNVPKDALATFEYLVRSRGDDAMAAVEVVDRRNYEYSCSACMMTLPMETVNAISRGHLTKCVSCGSILYTEEDIVKPKAGGKAKAGREA